MKVKYIITTLNPQEFPRNRLPEIGFIGRSNVGKSSLINALCGQRKMAKVSSTPGRTRGLSFYLINESLYFVDFPGYGYAKVPQTLKDKWKQVIESYLLTRETLRHIVHIIDIRHLPTADDKIMYDWLVASGVDTVTVATKSDKISRGRIKGNLDNIRKFFGMQPNEKLIPFSAVTGEGMRDLIELLEL
jgi:GTP-binding protein